MKKKILTVSIMLLFMLGALATQAQEKCDSIYMVSYSNYDRITVGNKKAEKGVYFNNLTQIHWAKDIENQALKVWNSKKSCYELIVFDSKNNKVSFITKNETNTKGWCDDNEPVAFDTLYYLLDTLRISTVTYHSSNVIDRLVFHIGEVKIDSTITKSKDRTEFIIPRAKFGKISDKPFYIDIIETDTEKNWEYAVWRKLCIVPLPLKIE